MRDRHPKRGGRQPLPTNQAINARIVNTVSKHDDKEIIFIRQVRWSWHSTYVNQFGPNKFESLAHIFHLREPMPENCMTPPELQIPSETEMNDQETPKCESINQ